MTTLIDIWLKEYERMKEEQARRIGFRDNLVYVTLAVIAAMSTAILKPPANYDLALAVPFFTFVLGWTFLINDQKISAIGTYLSATLAGRIHSVLKSSTECIECTAPDSVEAEQVFGWEEENRNEPHRKRKKAVQLLVDELTFVGTGVFAILIHCCKSKNISALDWTARTAGAILLIVLAGAIAWNATCYPRCPWTSKRNQPEAANAEPST